MLRIEYKGQPYDWFNLDEMGDIVRTSDFSNTLKENITHYFGVPIEFQAVYDEEGLLNSIVDYARAFRSIRPWLRVYDMREMIPELKEKTSQQLEEVYAEVARSRRNFCGPNSENGARGSSPRLAMADVVRSANESGLGVGSSYSKHSDTPPRNFQWNNTGMEASMLPNPVANSTSSRYATPPVLRTGKLPSSTGIPGVVPSATGIPGVVPAQPGVSPAPQAWMHPSLPQLPPQSTGLAFPHYSASSANGFAAPEFPQLGTQSPRSAQHETASPRSGNANALSGVPLVTAAPTVASSRPDASPKSEPSPRMSTRQDEPVVEVYLAKEPPFERFGFANVPSRDGRALLISWVDPTGLLEVRWNREHHDKRIVEGDRIIAVNNNGNLEGMRQQLQSKSVVLRVIRQTPDL